jgi:uncharacterized C2H2 Zn-finger protein
MKEVLGLGKGKGHHFCKLCGKYFTSAQRWSSHMRSVHGDAKPFKCEQCSAGFTQLADVQRHVDRTHTKVKNFKCGSCDSQYARKYELVQHQTSVHEKEAENGEEPMDFEENKLGISILYLSVESL